MKGKDRGHSPVHSAFAKTERRRTEGARLQRQSEGGPRGPSPVHSLFAKTDPEREREEQGPARSAQGDGRERAQGGRGFSLVFISRTDVAEKASKGDRER